MKKLIKKILVANRGEIASRVFATCREMKISTVAIYSSSDKNLQYVSEADEAAILDGDSLKETYLNMQAIISIAKQFNVDAIHPGYGFLSENATFAELVRSSGIIFIGPSAKNIVAMGNKSESKIFLQPLGIPFIPGYFGKNQEVNFLRNEAEKIGLPLLVKAAAGGGGKGMKIVEDWNDFNQKVEEAKFEAQKSFGDSQVMLEKYLKNPRHIEVQVFGDEHGNMVHFFERDCSLQRRHQKVVEEAPAPNLSVKQREKLFKDAETIVKAMKYENAGTLEFIMDETGVHYFLEMNTRLQVEHPVTELINGLDLVKLQIKVASGEVAPWKNLQTRHEVRGHAIEVRIYAEDPENNFFPTAGKINFLKYSNLKNVRYDFTYSNNNTVTMNFDPMIGKVIVWGESREEAIYKMIQALKETVILGFKTNIGFLINCLENSDFMKGCVSTSFIPNKIAELSKTTEKYLPTTFATFILSQMNIVNLQLDQNENVKLNQLTNRDTWDLISNYRI